MRTAKENDYWEKVYSVGSKYAITSIDLNGINGLEKIDLCNGIVALSGLNGAGKSTIIAAIKDLLGYDITKIDNIKIDGKQISGKLKIAGKIIDCENELNKRGKDNGIDINNLKYIDHERIIKTQEYLINGINIEEFLEQYEQYDISDKDLDELNYIIGKNYLRCSIREIEGEDLDASDKVFTWGTFPVFEVVQGDLCYDSRKMGIGEHYICFLFWQLTQLKRNDFIIIEEPETFISIMSQKNLINYMASVIVEKKVSIILTTHSPYILHRIQNDNIRVISARGGTSSILIPSDELSAEYLLGIDEKQYGTIFVEDKVAQEFLIAIFQDKRPEILRQFNIDIAFGGESAITERLSIKCSEKMKYKFIGVYDADVMDMIDTSKLVWPHCFMPITNPGEIEIKEYLQKDANVKVFCKKVNRRDDILIAILSRNDGMNYHDWFLELCKGISYEPQYVINVFYSIWKENHETEINSFLNTFDSCLR